MKTMFKLMLFSLLVLSFNMSSVAQTSTSKSCGSCHKPVSVSSKVGDYCPHCRVRWGYENTSTEYINQTSYTNTKSYTNYEDMNSLAFVTSNSNLRAYASTSASVLALIPAYSLVTIVGKYGKWYKVEYSEGGYATKNGYIHESLVSM